MHYDEGHTTFHLKCSDFRIRIVPSYYCSQHLKQALSPAWYSSSLIDFVHVMHLRGSSTNLSRSILLNDFKISFLFTAILEVYTLPLRCQIYLVDNTFTPNMLGSPFMIRCLLSFCCVACLNHCFNYLGMAARLVPNKR